MNTPGKLSPKQIRAAWIIAAVLVILHFTPRVMHSFLVAAAARKQASLPKKPSPAVPYQIPAPTPPVPSPLVAGLSPQAQAVFIGIFQATQFMPNGDRCNVRLEIRPDLIIPNKLSAYDTRTCISSNLMNQGTKAAGAIDEFRKDTSPVSTVMSGSLMASALVFHVDQTIGSAPDQCPMTSYTVSQFGVGAVAAKWEEGACPSGQMVLVRARG